MKHHNHSFTPAIKADRLSRRAEACLDYLLALIIGAGLATLLVAWWSA
jgi:hypothetical protein